MLAVQLLPGAISEIFVTVSETGILTQNDRYGLMAAILDENLEEEERRAIDRMFRAIKRGLVSVTNDFTAA